MSVIPPRLVYYAVEALAEAPPVERPFYLSLDDYGPCRSWPLRRGPTRRLRHRERPLEGLPNWWLADAHKDQRWIAVGKLALKWGIVDLGSLAGMVRLDGRGGVLP